jgi:hypothetical protein
MTTNPKPPAPPKGTGPAGRKLWKAVHDDWQLEAHEITLLTEAVRTVDALDELQAAVDRDGAIVPDRFGQERAHPALVEARQLRIALARLLAALRLPDGAEGDESQGRRSQRRVGARGTYGLRRVS